MSGMISGNVQCLKCRSKYLDGSSYWNLLKLFFPSSNQGIFTVNSHTLYGGATRANSVFPLPCDE